VPALLGKDLVFEMETRHAGPLEGPGGLAGVQGVAVAGVRIGNQRDVDDVDHALEPGDDLIEAHQPQVRDAVAAGDAAAGGIDRSKPRLLHQPGR